MISDSFAYGAKILQQFQDICLRHEVGQVLQVSSSPIGSSSSSSTGALTVSEYPLSKSFPINAGVLDSCAEACIEFCSPGKEGGESVQSTGN